MVQDKFVFWKQIYSSLIIVSEAITEVSDLAKPLLDVHGQLAKIVNRQVKWKNSIDNTLKTN